ncbi:MAG: hypothetical protein CL539_03725 [Alcanivorax sp.]|jgi:AraC-like DNA-binding protein|uniref:AraC family transcriptional regulator n=1 Tax=Alcanivorax TaxID=59753 RepID=UPI000C67ED29|nr:MULTISPECIES: AraC family transcriptional regulator [Alcanivorax]MAC13772.1 hypothetical protein [Alcanivorax sp.]MBG33715.1 hypothetical protein [Alcanivorax sp.]|tara:strand:- start:8189 stop:9220 length:1032 start_codon:yes stop_codon:yes gene_type:complete
MPDTLSACKISLDVMRQLLVIGSKQGLDVDALLANHQFRLEPMENDPAYMAGEEFERLMIAAIKALAQPLTGLELGSRALAQVFGVTAYLAQTASTVDSFLSAIIQAEPLLGTVGRSELHREPGEVHLIWHCQLVDPLARWHAIDFIMATLASFLSATVSPGTLDYEVQLGHPAPTDPVQTARYKAVFCCEVLFDQPQNRIILPARLLDHPINSADPQLNAVLSRHAQTVMEERKSVVSFKDTVTLQIKRLMLHGMASRENVAESLSITSRTLHRKLREESTSYRALLDGVRQEKACDLLTHTQRTVQSVASEIGFDEAHSFTRWFRQRTGMAPSQYRELPEK